jgi:putative phosphoesterase
MTIRLGILSDTHGRAVIARRAVLQLQMSGATHFVHCGDIADFGSDGRAVLDCLPTGVSWFVFGNNDFEHEVLRQYAGTIGISCLDYAGEFELGAKRFAVTHGDRPCLLDQFLDRADEIDYLLSGHTHQKHDLRAGSVRRINPGALHRARPKSVALLNPESDTLEFLIVPEAN